MWRVYVCVCVCLCVFVWCVSGCWFTFSGLLPCCVFLYFPIAGNIMLLSKELTLMSTKREFNLDTAELLSCANVRTGVCYFEARIEVRCNKCTVLVVGSSPKFCGSKHHAFCCAWENLFFCFDRLCLCMQNQAI